MKLNINNPQLPSNIVQKIKTSACTVYEKLTLSISSSVRNKKKSCNFYSYFQLHILVLTFIIVPMVIIHNIKDLKFINNI